MFSWLYKNKAKSKSKISLRTYSLFDGCIFINWKQKEACDNESYVAHDIFISKPVETFTKMWPHKHYYVI